MRLERGAGGKEADSERETANPAEKPGLQRAAGPRGGLSSGCVGDPLPTPLPGAVWIWMRVGVRRAALGGLG